MATTFPDFNVVSSLVTGDYFVGHNAAANGEWRATATNVATALAQQIAPTWNNALTVFKALEIAVTDTASDSNSVLAKFSVGGSEKFGVSKSGYIRIGADQVLAHVGTTMTVGKSGDTLLDLFGQVDIDGNQTLINNGTTLTLGASGLTQAVIPSGVNVGIGTTTPYKDLHVYAGAFGGAYDAGIVDGAVIEGSGSFVGLNILGTNTSSCAINFGDQDDTNVGILQYKHATNVFSFRTNAAADTMTLDGSGNVGIGTTAPTQLLSLNAASGEVYTQYAQAGVAKVFTGISSTAGNPIAGMVAGEFGIRTQGTAVHVSTDSGVSTSLVVKNGGDVGIGTTTPATILHTKTASNNYLTLESASGSSCGITGYDGATRGYVLWDSLDALRFYCGGGSGGDLKMSILTSGNVGIGTTTPGALLQLGENQATNDTPQILLSDNVSFRGEIGYSEASLTEMYFANTYGNAGATMEFRMGGNTSAATKMAILGNGNVGIGTTAPTAAKFQIAGPSSGPNNGAVITTNVFTTSSVGSGVRIGTGATSGNTYGVIDVLQSGGNSANGDLAIAPQGGDVGIGTTAPGENLHVTGKAAVGGTASVTVDAASARFQVASVQSVDSSGGRLLQVHYDNSVNSVGPIINLTRSRGSTIGSSTIVQSGDWLGTIRFRGSDGSSQIAGAEITAEVDATPGASDMPGRLIFKTCADGAASATERMRITNDGKIQVAAGGHIELDRTTADSKFINFKATADADATSAISTLTTSGATTHHIQIEINGVTAWIAASTTDPS